MTDAQSMLVKLACQLNTHHSDIDKHTTHILAKYFTVVKIHISQYQSIYHTRGDDHTQPQFCVDINSYSREIVIYRFTSRNFTDILLVNDDGYVVMDCMATIRNSCIKYLGYFVFGNITNSSSPRMVAKHTMDISGWPKAISYVNVHKYPEVSICLGGGQTVRKNDCALAISDEITLYWDDNIVTIYDDGKVTMLTSD